MNNIFEDLSWLPRPPLDFAQKLKDATNGAQLRELAKFSLDENDLRRLYKKTLSLQNSTDDLSPLVPLNIGLISNATTQLLVPALVATALRFGISLQVIEAEFNQVAQEAFSQHSKLMKQNLNNILVALDYRGLPLLPCPGNQRLAKKNVQNCLGYIKSIIESLQRKTGSQIFLQNIPPPCEALFGSYDGRLPGSLNWLIRNLNAELGALKIDNTVIVDMCGLASNVGLGNWHDPTLWNLAKISFSQRYLPMYADYVCRIIAAAIGKSRRCLILDLDNTLWGGVIGDDGLEGILLGNGDATAEAHLHLQQIILALRERGIILAVSSKNEDATARKVFREHPDMLIREEHIAVFRANWADKASNIRVISELLSLGLDSMVFLDDNPAERMQVRRELPEVAVPELPKDPALYGRTLIAAGYFEAIAFSDEDRNRANFYAGNVKRAEILTQSSDVSGYLKSLDMEISFTPFDEIGRSRITQLINKSNQFNLTTKRYSELEIKKLEGDQCFYTRQIRLKDIFGDNGMISVIICKKSETAWVIDTWLMSCRVLNRSVELAVLQDILQNAKKDGANKLIGIYVPSARNAIVKEHYKKLGFTQMSVSSADEEIWELDIPNAVIEPLLMKVKYAV